ncbi:MAG: aldehyde dehydrogenase family protein, partial [Firmicutes bacterium]|nr:aldehyde dehydrogenase family protein [Bacillota bacterium]
MEIENIVKSQKAFFKTGATLPLAFRYAALKKLHEKMQELLPEILQALRDDLGKSDFEGYLTEVGLAFDELHYMEKHLRKLARTRRVKSSLGNFRSRSYIKPSPFGTVL